MGVNCLHCFYTSFCQYVLTLLTGTSDKNEEECIKEGRQCESGLCEDSEGESGEVGEGGLCESGEGESGEEEGEVEVLPGQSVSRKRKRKKQKKRKRTLAEQQSLMKREEVTCVYTISCINTKSMQCIGDVYTFIHESKYTNPENYTV